ncbi:MAG: Hsp20/alpha crystallin family protein [Acidobacteriota bacterium]|nr:Hsp20/alpha crystallin family protein [Acidobacteriota bacterium]
MNYLTFDPYREFNRIFGGGTTPARRDREEEMSLGAWIPPVDIHEDQEKLVLTAELPGFKQDQIEIQLEGGVLTIRGERRFEDKDNGKNYHRVERSYGQFVRSFTLPNNVDRDNVRARFSDGLLHIEIPKREEAKPRQIRISDEGEKEGRGKDKTIDVQSRA